MQGGCLQIIAKLQDLVCCLLTPVYVIKIRCTYHKLRAVGTEGCGGSKPLPPTAHVLNWDFMRKFPGNQDATLKYMS
jgi:hypothetical protein